MLFDDTYRTISRTGEGLFKEKGSKFISVAHPIRNEHEAQGLLAAFRGLHPKAVHHCYAYRLGLDRMSYRLSDDGEPSGTAGRPILNTLYARDVTNILIVVGRYFGGTLLGVPGLIRAYKTATELAVDNAEIMINHLSQSYEITFPYFQMNHVMRIVKEMDLPVVEQEFEMQCRIVLDVRNTWVERFKARCGQVDGLALKAL